MGVENIIQGEEDSEEASEAANAEAGGDDDDESNESKVAPVFLQDIKIDSDGQILIIARRVFLELLKRSSIKKMSELMKAKSFGGQTMPFDLQKCKILKEIGSGQFGKVYLAVNQENQFIAVKVVPKSKNKDGKQKKWLKTIFEVV